MSLISIDEIRANLLESGNETDKDKEPVATSRLTNPLKNAHKNVAQAAASIAMLSPAQRKEACISLIDISEEGLRSVEKVLRRTGTSDSALLTSLRKIIKLLEQFDESFGGLLVKESVDRVPDEFDSGEINDTVQVTAYRYLQDNSDFTPEEAEEADEPVEGEANLATVNSEEGEGNEDVINILADPPADKQIPEAFKPKTDFNKVATESETNFALLRKLTGNI